MRAKRVPRAKSLATGENLAKSHGGRKMFHVELWEACGRFVWLSGGKLGRFAPLVAAARPGQMFHVEHSAISVSIQRLTDGMFHAEQIQQLGMRALRFARACEYGMPPGRVRSTWNNFAPTPTLHSERGVSRGTLLLRHQVKHARDFADHFPSG